MRTPNWNLRNVSRVTAWLAAVLCWEANPSCDTAAAAVKADMLSPTNGTRFIGCATNFIWNAGVGVSRYALWVGSTNLSYDILARFVSPPATNLAVTTLPVDGRNLYLTLYSLINGVWEANSYTYVATNIPTAARMLSPTPGTTLVSPTTTFLWTNSAVGAPYGFWVGSSPGSFDLYAGFEPTNSRTLTLPSDGRTIYTTLWSLTNIQATAGWVPNSYVYNAPSPAKAQIVSPPPGTTNYSEFVTFEWDKGIAASPYALWVGSTPNSYDLYAGVERGSSRTVRLPVDGRPLYVTLWSWINGAWQPSAYTYTAANPVGTNAARIFSPPNGASLSTYQLFRWSNSPSATRYALWVGNSPLTYNLYAAIETGADVAFSGSQPILSRFVPLPSDGRPIHVTLWSWINNTWVPTTNTYTAAAGPQQATIVRPLAGITLGNRATFYWNSGSNATMYALWVGSGGLGTNTDIYARFEGTARSRTLVLPADGRPLSVRLWSMIDSAWAFTNYTYRTSISTPARIISPPDGSVLAPGPASTSFITDGGVGVTRLALRLGTTPLGFDIRDEIWDRDFGPSGYMGPVTNLPPAGTTVYATLWSFIDGEWQVPNTYTYTTGPELPSVSHCTRMLMMQLVFGSRPVAEAIYWMRSG
ncbi:MAG: hypothetical protein N2689_09955 [Verrucomicrobiae bacterium]|nr:hypothetical protein [Verrucomicrobiae bacterium]